VINQLYVQEYSEEYRNIWERFINNESSNGTFLQTRNFLDYHPAGRFKDISVMILDDKNNIITACPACEINEHSKKVFFSHKGATFGGPVIRRKKHNARDLGNIIDFLDSYFKEAGYDKAVLKITPDIFAASGDQLLQYILSNKGYQHYSELSSYIDFKYYDTDILKNFSSGKKENVRKSEKCGMCFKKLDKQDEKASFFALLTQNLKKYDASPVHTLNEINDLIERLNNKTDLYGVFSTEGILIAGSFVFDFSSTNTLHTQYLCAVNTNDNVNPMSFLGYSLIELALQMGYEKLSWGISTENMGRELNQGLIQSKEGYGSKYSLNHTFWKDF